MITGWGAHMYDIAQWGNGTDTDSGPIEVQATADFPKRGLFDVHVGYKAEAMYANGVKLISHNGSAGVKFIGDKGWVRVWRGGWAATGSQWIATSATILRWHEPISKSEKSSLTSQSRNS